MSSNVDNIIKEIEDHGHDYQQLSIYGISTSRVLVRFFPCSMSS